MPEPAMNPAEPSPFTLLLNAAAAGDQGAFARLLDSVYGELRAIAQNHMNDERAGHTLQATALVNEAYIRLIDVRQMNWQNRAHFLAMAARLMRRILVDSARAKRYQKRGGDDVRVTFDEGLAVAGDASPDLVALDDALRALAKMDERRSQIIELRFFGGLTVEETAVVLKVSPDTVMRDSRLAKAWLARELAGGKRRPAIS
jgi:RNA polymerase sigma factor (TIGR02999 family)